MTKISIENLGPIVKGEVELKPLTIFIGPSNTGKSYMATAIYAVMSAFEGFLPGLRTGPLRPHGRTVHSRFSYSSDLPSLDEESGVTWDFSEWVSQRAEDVLDRGALTVSHLPAVVRPTLERVTREFLSLLQNEALNQLHQAFGRTSDLSNRRNSTEGFSLTVRRDNPHLTLDIRSLGEIKSATEFDISQARAPTPGDDLRTSIRPYQDACRWLWDEFIYGMRDSVAESLLGGLPSRIFYMPATRSGIAQGHRILAAALVRQSSRRGLEPVNIPPLPGITTDFLSNYISVDSRMGRRNSSDELVKSISFIEHEVLHGKIDVDDAGELPYPGIVYEPIGSASSIGRFNLNQTSSMVSELAPVILFLRYLVSEGDLLILEEPEAHLHPAAQRQMARAIVRLVNAGVKVLITTHSDLLLAAINNLMRLSFADDGKLSGLGFEREDCLSHDAVSAYRFAINETQGGSLVHELEIRRDVGIDDAEFGKVVNELYDETIAVEQIPIK